MNHKWLSFLTFGFIIIVTFIFFYIKIQPIPLPNFEEELALKNINEPTVTFVNPSKGPADAKITVVEFGDFQCIACKEIIESIEIALQTYPNDVRLIWKNLPNESLHNRSTPSAVAAHCAARQNKFWEFHEMLFLNQDNLTDITYTNIAKELEMNIDRFLKCYTTNDTLPIVTKDFEEGLALKITATPTVYVGDELLIGYFTSTEIIAAIQRQLNKPIK